MSSLIYVLYTKLGYESFRPGQLEAIHSIANGKHFFLVLGTGGGKSMVYLMLHLLTGEMVIVLEPTISVMQDQQLSILKLNEKKTLNIKTIALISGLNTDADLKRVADGDVDIGLIQHMANTIECSSLVLVFLPPEILRTWRLRFEALMRTNKLGCVCHDEVHCAALWSHHSWSHMIQLSL